MANINYKEHLMPVSELEIGEYAYHVELKLNSKKKLEVDPVFYTIICGLLNTSGGVIKLIIPTGTNSSFDEWCNNLKDKLNCVPEDVYTSCISHKNEKECNFVLVKKSMQFISIDSHLYTRSRARLDHVRHYNSIVNIIRQTCSRIEYIVPSIFHQEHDYGSKCSQMETENVEFKNFGSCKSAKDLIRRFSNTDDRTIRMILAMANTISGGCVVLGVNEDKTTKDDPEVGKDQHTFCGQELDESEEADFRRELSKLLTQTCGPTIEDQAGFRSVKNRVSRLSQTPQNQEDKVKRIWGDTDMKPLERMHWSCTFVPLRKSSYSPLEKRRVLIIVKIDPCAGGLFEETPEAAVVNDDGSIYVLSFEEWLARHRLHTARGRTNIQEKIEGVQQNSAASRSEDQTSEPLIQNNQTGTLKDNTNIAYTENSSHYGKEPRSPSHTISDIQHNDLFKLTRPMSYTPDLVQIQAELEHAHCSNALLEAVEKDTGETEAHCIQAPTFFSIIDHGVDLTTFSSDQATLLKKPNSHVMDLLIVRNASPLLLLFVLGCALEKTEGFSDLLAYALILARTLKKKVLEQMKCADDYQYIGVRCCIVCPDTVYRCSDFYLRWLPDLISYSRSQNVIQNLRKAFADIFFRKETKIRDAIQRHADIELSNQQIRTLVFLDRNKFSIIEGPPGSGKTLLAQYLCKQFSKDAAYISACAGLNSRVGHDGVNVYYAENSAAVFGLLKDKLTKKHHIVIDDNHNYVYTDDILHGICGCIATDNDKRLYVFEDSKYQNYQEVQSTSKFQKFLNDHSSEYGSPNCKLLTEIRRNSWVVGSYILAQIPDIVDNPNVDRVTIESGVDGDNTYLVHIRNLRSDHEDNGLIAHAKQILSEMDGGQQRYTPSDLAILTDHETSDVAKKEAEMFRRLFARDYPQCPVQTAAICPVKGLIIDTLPNFSGLEAAAVLFVLPKEAEHDSTRRKSVESSVKSMWNPKYRVAVASRGRDRIEFLQEENIDTSHADIMKFDKLPESLMRPAPVDDSTPAINPDNKDARTAPTEPEDEVVRVLYAYQAKTERELTIWKGNSVRVLEKDTEREGWWKGEKMESGEVGLFPKSYTTQPLKVRAASTYDADSDDKISMNEGDIINVLNKNTGTLGWWLGELKGTVGLFPSKLVTSVQHNTDKD